MGAGQSRPREGLDRPHWRAKQRHQHDRAKIAASDPYEHLQAWLQERRWAQLKVAPLEALDLTAYLRDTARIDLGPTDRLRELAIALESSLLSVDQPRGWLALERIYNFARALDPRDAVLETSRAITAEAASAQVGDRLDLRRRMILSGREAAGRAIEIRPSHAAAHHMLGMLDYSFRDGSIESALACFQRAIAEDPNLGWARLYRAHCLHDLGRWEEAAEAYSEVAPSFLTEHRAWRYDLFREQRAWCLLQAGYRERALAEFVAILHRYELEPKLAQRQLLRELTAAAEGPLQAELSDRLTRLRRVMDRPDDDTESADECEYLKGSKLGVRGATQQGLASDGASVPGCARHGAARMKPKSLGR